MSDQRSDPRPTWELVLQVAHDLTVQGRTPFRLRDIVEGVQGIDPQRAYNSIAPVVQGMTDNAGRGPRQSCGHVLHREDPGWYRLLRSDELEIGSATPSRPAPAIPASPTVTDLLAEDEVKAAVRDYLTALGYKVEVAWGHEHGVDIKARHGVERNILIEAKGEVRSDQQQGNYFLMALGELVQRLDDPNAFYGLALPDNRRYRGLVDRLPPLARQRLSLIVFFVRRSAEGLVVSPDLDIEQWM